jgi:hypothetical protein
MLSELYLSTIQGSLTVHYMRLLEGFVDKVAWDGMDEVELDDPVGPN